METLMVSVKVEQAGRSGPSQGQGQGQGQNQSQSQS